MTPNTSLMYLASTFFKSRAPGILPARTSMASGITTLLSSLSLFCQVKIRLEGYPNISSMGDMAILLAPKPRIDVNTRVLAKPQRPFTKNAVIVAMIQSISISGYVRFLRFLIKAHTGSEGEEHSLLRLCGFSHIRGKHIRRHR